ncbi:MAG TPA: ABC transporter permease subunit [Vicinamibacterales bacterium]|jgi:sodium transport system permease protein|nr:ABC transporter permease subunit [Vicinamibacterales bacterium]
MNGWLVVARKEITDHGRDTRSLLSSALLALMGPIVVLFVSFSDRVRAHDGAALLLGMLSVFALVSAFAGGMNVAMDATAGERERRSLLPLLLNPTSRSDVVIGKWIAVTVFTLGGLALNSAGLVLVLARTAPLVLLCKFPQLVVWIALGLVPLSLLGAALTLLVATLFRTTKEAHTGLSFLMFVPMIVGMFLVFFPEWARGLSFVLPIVGQQALIGLPAYPVPVARGAALAVTTMAATVAVLIVAVRVLDRDEILTE